MSPKPEACGMIATTRSPGGAGGGAEEEGGGRLGGRPFPRREPEAGDRLGENAHRRARLQVVVDRGHPDAERDQEGKRRQRAIEIGKELELEDPVEHIWRQVGGDESAARAGVRVKDAEADAEDEKARGADDEEDEQDAAPRQFGHRVARDGECGCHIPDPPSLMKEGMWSRCGWFASTNRTKTSSRLLPSGTTSFIAPSCRTRPFAMIATVSQTSSTSLRRWLLSRTATPVCFRRSMRARTSRRPSGSRSAVGSSRMRSFGRPRIAWAIPRRCFMPFEYWRICLRSPSRPANCSVSGMRRLRSTSSTPSKAAK